MPPTTTSSNEPEIRAPKVPQTLTDPCPTSPVPEDPPTTRRPDRPDYEFVGYGTSSSDVLSILTAIYTQGRGQLKTGFYVYPVEPKPTPLMTNSDETAFNQAKEIGRVAAAAKGGESSVLCVFARNCSTMSWRYVPAENPDVEGEFFWWQTPYDSNISYDYLVSEVDGDPDIWQIKFNQRAVGDLLAAECDERVN